MREKKVLNDYKGGEKKVWRKKSKKHVDDPALVESDTTCRAACVSGKYYFEVMAHVLSKAGL